MNENSSSLASEADDLDEAPVWTEADFAQAVHREGLKPVPRKKQRINIALDPDVLEWFRHQTGGRGYQTLINATLREAMERKGLEETLRRVIREELHPT